MHVRKKLLCLVVFCTACPDGDGGGGGDTDTAGGTTGTVGTTAGTTAGTDTVGTTAGTGTDTDGELACPPEAKLPVVPVINCDILGQGQWENHDGSSVAPWDEQGSPPWEDWSQVEPCKNGNREDDATGVLAVHAVHLPTGKVLLWEGLHDQHTWDIVNDTFEWYPLTSQAGYDGCYVAPDHQDPPDPGAIDLFCAGHTLDAAGNVVAAGANLTGSVASGSICGHVLPIAAQDGTGAVSVDDGNLCISLGDFEEPSTTPWVFGEFFQTPRWYPTLTTLPSGEVLMTAGFVQGNQGAAGPLVFEGFDGED